MNGYLKYITAAFLIILTISVYPPMTWAERDNIQPLLFNESQKFFVTAFAIPSKAEPKLSGFRSLGSETASDKYLSAEQTPVSLKPHQYTLLVKSDLKMPSIYALYQTHGFNRAVEGKLNFYSKKFKGGFINHLNRAGKYLETMIEIFRRKNLPQELVFLPLIESGFRLNVYSPKKAAGPWQFIPSTAKKFGLTIDWWVDERLDPIKSTIAAAEYLNNLYEMFNSWNLALAAYNAGEGKILKAVKTAKSNDFWELRKTKYIKRETKDYVPSYIAATAIALAPESFGFDNIVYTSPLKFDEVEITSPMDLAVAAEFTGVSVDDIKELNPELKRWCTPPNVSSYTLRIPSGTKKMFLSNMANASEENLLYVEPYTVKKGDTVGEIAKRFGVPAQAIIDLNSLGKKALIRAGAEILVPAKITADASHGNKTDKGYRPILKNRSDRKPGKKTSI